jgi:hypothetical protein
MAGRRGKDQRRVFVLRGLAAAAGSSYWHDKLSKVRNLKAASEQAKKLKV